MILDRTDTTYYKSVRGLLGGVDEFTLPDTDIDDPTVLDMAEIKVMDILPRLSDPDNPFSSTEMAKVRLAVIHLMAASLCVSMPQRIEIEVRTIDTTWKKKPIDYTDLAEKLTAKALDLLESLSEDGLGDSIIFAIAPSKRAVREKYEKH